MRVILKKDIQRKLVERAKRRSNLTWRGLAEHLHIAETTLRNEWRHGNLTLPLDTYKQLVALAGINISASLSVTRPDNWGQSIGALKSNRLRAGKIRTPAKGAELAEFIGIFLGDGNLYVDTTKGMYVVRVFLNSLTETNYAKYIKALIKRLFGIDTRIVQMKEVNCIYVNAQNKALTEFLIEQGMRSGDKIRNGITIPDWVWRNPDALRACVRGLIDTDGSVYRLVPHWPNLIQISFKNNNFRLLQDARKALLRLDFKVSAVSGNRIYITQQAEVKRYFKEVGSSK